MNYERFDLIEFEAGEYIILNIITYKNNTYLYLINNAEDKDDVSVVKVIENDGVTEYVPIENDEEFEYVINRLLIDNEGNVKNLKEKDEI